MGSDKKRKRVSADTADVPTDLADKLERKRLKKEKKNKTENGGDDREACETVTPLVSPIATRKFRLRRFSLHPFSSPQFMHSKD